MSIVFYDVEEWERGFLPSAILGNRVKLVSDRLNASTARQAGAARVVAVFSWSRVDEAVLEHLPGLAHIVTRSTGVDHIDLKACQRRGITVSNVPSYGERTVAEHTLALVLALSRRLFQAGFRGREGNFSRDGLRGFDLAGKTMGIIGCGKIGSKVAIIAKAFAMRVVALDPKPPKELAGTGQIKFVKNLNELLKQADVISLHAPLTEQTRHMINMETIKWIKPGAILVNTARGDLIQTAALLKALDQGRLKGVGLDVLEHERLIEEEAEVLSKSSISNQELSGMLRNHILFSHPEVIVTPHNAFNSEEAVAKILETTVGNIKAFLTGKKKNLVST